MSNFRKDYDSASEVTAVLSILKEGHSASLKAEHLRYTILLWLVGKVLMPPYLPRIIKRVRAGSRSEILQRLNGLAVQYREKHADHILDAHDAIKVWERVAVVGEDIAKFIGPLGDCLEALAKSNMDIKNVIIHTDEHTIPWHLAVSEYMSEEISVPCEFDFLCNRYSCGTILVDEAEEAAFPRFIRHSRRSVQPDRSDLPSKQVFFIAGELGETTPEGKDLGLAYVEELKRRLEASPDCVMPIHCFSVTDWLRNGRDVSLEFKSLFQRGQIIHFTGHFVDGKMLLAKGETPIGHSELADLPELNSRPLVVLHGCSSAGPAGADTDNSQVYKAFLNKGAGGCLATVLPVNLPTKFSVGPETLLEIFYSNLFSKPWVSYGTTLQEARQQLNKLRPSDPQALFYQLFGDPRETLISPRERTVTQLAELLDREEGNRKLPSKATLTLRISGEDLSAEEITRVLNDMDEVVAVSYQPPAVVMDETISELLTISEFVFTLVLFTPAVFAKVKTRLEKVFKHIRIHSSSDSKDLHRN